MIERKAKEIIHIIQTVCIMLLILIITYVLFKGILTEIYSGKQIKTVVIDCVPVTENTYEITVETEDGEQYAYYSDSYRETGTEIIKGE